MRTILFLLLLLSLNSFATKYYVSSTGSDAAAGTYAAPRKSIRGVWPLITSRAKDTIYVRGGTYYVTAEQTVADKDSVQILPYPGEHYIIDGTNVASKEYGALVRFENCDNLRIVDMEIRHYHFPGGGNDAYIGVYVKDCNNCRFELINSHHNDSGFTITGHSDNNLILNTDVHHNGDPYSTIPYGNGDGFSATFAYYSSGWKSDSTLTNTIQGCRFYWNSDNGISSYYNNSLLIITDCWSWMNGYQPGATVNDRDTTLVGGDGVGFKLGITETDYPGSIKRKLTRCVSAYNAYIGYDQNQTTNSARIQIENSIAYHNSWRGFHMAYTANINHVGINNISYANGYIGYWHSTSTLLTNSFLNWNTNNTSLCTVSDADFVSLNYLEMLTARKSDGSLPDINFLHLATGSDLIDKGTDVGNAYYGSAPDLGPFEYYVATKRYIITLTR